MKVVFILACACFSVASAEWFQVWSDEFEGGDLKEKWNFELGCNGWGNNELQCYMDNRETNVRQNNGILTIEAHREWMGDGTNDLPFTSTRMTTKASWYYGKMEMRARLPKGKHLWPAFWMMPQNSDYGGWPRSGEIDIMEYRGQRPQQILGTLHFGASPGEKGQIGTGETDFPIDFSADFHVFGIDWSPTQVHWMLDGEIYHTENIDRNLWPSVYTANGQPFDKNFFIIINLAVGGSFFGGEPFDPIEADSWPKATYEIDWIRKFEWR